MVLWLFRNLAIVFLKALALFDHEAVQAAIPEFKYVR